MPSVVRASTRSAASEGELAADVPDGVLRLPAPVRRVDVGQLAFGLGQQVSDGGRGGFEDPGVGDCEGDECVQALGHGVEEAAVGVLTPAGRLVSLVPAVVVHGPLLIL